MIKRRGNPNWGKPQGRAEAGLSTFEQVVKTLKLSPEELKDSRELKEWVRIHKDQKYVPPALLKLWGFTVKVSD
ncbi:MAG TPA: hypothetical protein VK473_05285 [Terriglobales bacterium]|nr:hypothetical protein [Terriglobales bacterium]